MCLCVYVQARKLLRKTKSQKEKHRETHLLSLMLHFLKTCTHSPCGRLGGAGLLEGHLEGMRSRVVGVGGDGWGRRQALKGGVGLRVWRGGGHGRRGGVLGAVGAGGRCAAPQALHAAAQQVVLGLGRKEEGRE